MLHRITFSVVLLVVVMLATVGPQPVRRLLLGLPIGTFLHLVFDGAWTDTDVFWWPFGGPVVRRRAAAVGERGLVDVPARAVGVALMRVDLAPGTARRPARRRAAFCAPGRLELAVGTSPRGGVVD